MTGGEGSRQPVPVAVRPACSKGQEAAEAEEPAPSDAELAEALRLLTPATGHADVSTVPSHGTLVAAGQLLAEEAARAAAAGPRWVAEPVTLSPEEAAISLEAEMFRTFAASPRPRPAAKLNPYGSPECRRLRPRLRTDWQKQGWRPVRKAWPEQGLSMVPWSVVQPSMASETRLQNPVGLRQWMAAVSRAQRRSRRRTESRPREDRSRSQQRRSKPSGQISCEKDCGGGCGSDLRGCGGSGRDRGCGGTEWRASRRGGCRGRRESGFEFRCWGSGIHGQGRESEIGEIELASDPHRAGQRGGEE